MKKTIKLAVVAALALGATSAFATNGDNMIATGAKARAMGGVGIATSFGAESSISNPALLSSVKSSELSGSITVFMPDVTTRSTNAAGLGFAPATATKSGADISYIPEFAYATRVNNNLVYGVSVTGTAGMGIDFDGNNNPNVAQMTTELQLMKIAVPVSYQMGALSLGVAPILQYGTLAINNLNTRDNTNALTPQGGSGSDLTLGYEVGAAYDVTSDLTVGAVYKSKLHMQYDTALSNSIRGFGGAAGTGISSGDNLDQPAEYGAGVSYVMGGNTFAVDYKKIEWGSANGYADFGWEDQDVYSIGYEYATKSWAFRLGYNHSESPIKEQAAANMMVGDYSGAVKNFFNLSGFPGMVESHYTLGGGYNMSDDLSLDFAVVYAAEETNSFDTTALSQGAYSMLGMGAFAGTSSADVKHSQLGVTVGATYKF